MVLWCYSVVIGALQVFVIPECLAARRARGLSFRKRTSTTKTDFRAFHAANSSGMTPLRKKRKNKKIYYLFSPNLLGFGVVRLDGLRFQIYAPFSTGKSRSL
mgnify:CR=1 FL=1